MKKKSTKKRLKKKSGQKRLKQKAVQEQLKQEVLQKEPQLKTNTEKPKHRFPQKRLVMAGIVVVLATMIITSYALFAGNHSLYINKTNAKDFCSKCHADKVAIMNLGSNVHRNAGCACHGYNPNVTEAYNINAAHNLTKKIYCTNCHANYNNSTGNIMIHNGTISAPNQSAHYLINKSNKNLIYQNAKGFFNNSTR